MQNAKGVSVLNYFKMYESFYELTAIVLKFGKDEYQKQVHERINYYHQHLIYWQENIDKVDIEWASFLINDNRTNKEKLLNERKGI